jgi:hypothetical protein
LCAFSHAAVTRRLQNTMFGRASRRLADYWLTCWRSDALPLWPTFDTTPIADLAPGLLAFELRTDDTLICTLCGDAVKRALGMDLTGEDWIGLAPGEQRAQRLAGYRAITAGAVGHCIRHARHRSGSVHYAEEILLPFAPLASGARPVLVHLGWRPIEVDASTAEICNNRDIPDEIALISLED